MGVTHELLKAYIWLSPQQRRSTRHDLGIHDRRHLVLHRQSLLLFVDLRVSLLPVGYASACPEPIAPHEPVVDDRRQSARERHARDVRLPGLTLPYFLPHHIECHSARLGDALEHGGELPSGTPVQRTRNVSYRRQECFVTLLSTPVFLSVGDINHALRHLTIVEERLDAEQCCAILCRLHP
eukprot:3514763-Prymnesium_polylepis.2